MKKILLAFAIVLTMSLGASAQYFNGGKDGFFNDWEDVDNGLDRTEALVPALPHQHGLEDDQEAPLGSGLVILTALGGAYALARRKKE